MTDNFIQVVVEGEVEAVEIDTSSREEGEGTVHSSHCSTPHISKLHHRNYALMERNRH